MIRSEVRQEQALGLFIQDGHRVDLYAESWADDCLPRQVNVVPVTGTGRTRLERIWSAVQTSAGWRFLNLWRGARKWLLPAGTRARKVYDAVLRRYRRSTVVTQ